MLRVYVNRSQPLFIREGNQLFMQLLSEVNSAKPPTVHRKTRLHQDSAAKHSQNCHVAGAMNVPVNIEFKN